MLSRPITYTSHVVLLRVILDELGKTHKGILAFLHLIGRLY